jgi:hypothetical protein
MQATHTLNIGPHELRCEGHWSHFSSEFIARNGPLSEPGGPKIEPTLVSGNDMAKPCPLHGLSEKLGTLGDYLSPQLVWHLVWDPMEMEMLTLKRLM